MKGPGMRLDLDVRRLWRCPACSTERHTPGQVTFVRCHFCKDHPAMQLVEQLRPLREPPPPLDLTIDLHPDDVDAPAFVPVHLRDAEEPAASDTMTQIVSEPPAKVEESVEPVVPAPTETAEEAPTTEAPPVEVSDEGTREAAATRQSQPSRKKKRRNRRQRRRNRSAQSADGSDSAPPSDDSTGAGGAP